MKRLALCALAALALTILCALASTAHADRLNIDFPDYNCGGAGWFGLPIPGDAQSFTVRCNQSPSGTVMLPIRITGLEDVCAGFTRSTDIANNAIVFTCVPMPSAIPTVP